MNELFYKNILFTVTSFPNSNFYPTNFLLPPVTSRTLDVEFVNEWNSVWQSVGTDIPGWKKRSKRVKCMKLGGKWNNQELIADMTKLKWICREKGNWPIEFRQIGIRTRICRSLDGCFDQLNYLGNRWVLSLSTSYPKWLSATNAVRWGRNGIVWHIVLTYSGNRIILLSKWRSCDSKLICNIRICSKCLMSKADYLK